VAGNVWIFGKLGTDWTYATQLRLENGCWIVSELRVFPTSYRWINDGYLRRDSARHERAKCPIPAGGLNARHLRKIQLRGTPAVMLNGLFTWARHAAHHYEATDGVKKRDRRTLQLARVATEYARALREGTRAPTAVCARRLGLPTATVRNLVHQARLRGFLTGSRGQGIAGGEITLLTHSALKMRMVLEHPERTF
jgi:hypothetical protein